MLCLHRMHALLALPAWYAKTVYDGKVAGQPAYAAASLTQLIAPMDQWQIMAGHVGIIRCLTK